jgi:hypothetical protein
MGMNTRTLLTVLAVVAVAFVATNCLAATVDANKPCDANKSAEPNKATISVVDFSKYTEAEKGKGCDKDKDPNKKGCDKDPNKATIISASDFGTFAEANKPADINKPAEPNKTKLAADNGETGKKGKGHHHKKDPNEPNKPAEPNKATIISASDFGTFADANKPADVNKPAEPNKTKLAADNGEKGKGHHHRRDPNQMEPNQPKDPNDKK